MLPASPILFGREVHRLGNIFFGNKNIVLCPDAHTRSILPVEHKNQ
jgi:hypothetical protein